MTATVVQCLDTAGTLVLDVSTGGYEAVFLPGADETWDQELLKSRAVDGHTVLSETLVSLVHEVHVRIRGASWAEVETRRLALKAATSGSSQWLLRIVRGGIEEVWRCDRASSTSPQQPYDVRNLRRDVYLHIPAQPTAARRAI